jgi:hypothetical protein
VIDVQVTSERDEIQLCFNNRCSRKKAGICSFIDLPNAAARRLAGAILSRLKFERDLARLKTPKARWRLIRKRRSSVSFVAGGRRK